MKDIFTTIYDHNYWGDPDSRSGTGSSLEQTAHLRFELEKLFQDLNIKSVLDIPCGDFHWMKDFSLINEIEYIGADIVDKIIDYNIENYQKENILFQTLDLTQDSLPTTDLIIIRDCLVHFTFDKIEEAFTNLKNQEYKYALITSFVERPSNADLHQIGEWRPLNLMKPPFALPDPLKTINEKCTEANGAFEDKSMCLWKKEDLDRLIFNTVSSFDLGI